MAKKKPATKEIKKVKKPAKPVKNEIVISDKMEQVLIQGNLASLSPEDRVIYYNGLCKSIGLNPLTKPFEYITLNGKLTLYARKDATEQLRKKYGVSVYDYRTEEKNGVIIYTAFLQDAKGRKDIGTGVVSIHNLSGDTLANAIMKAETKAKRRGTLSICGLGMLDETELETIPESAKSPMRSANIEPEQIAEKNELEIMRIELRNFYKELRESKMFTDDELQNFADLVKDEEDTKVLKEHKTKWESELEKRKSL